MRSFAARVSNSVVALALLAVGLAAAPVVQPNGGILEVDRAFAAKVAVADHDYQEKVTAARSERLNALRTLLDKAMDRKDLDAAIQIRDAIKAGENDATSTPASLEQAIAGTSWAWGDDTLTFQPGGNVAEAQGNWRGLVTTWKVIDRRTVLLLIQHGRPTDRYAILTFSPGIDSYSGFGFDFGPLPVNQRRKK